MADNAENAKEGVSLDSLRQELGQMRDELTKILDAAGETARAKAKDAAASAEHVAEEASRVAHKGCGVLRESVRDQPVAALSIAAGVGLVVGLLLHRR